MLIQFTCSNGDEIAIEDDGCGTWIIKTFDPADFERLRPMQQFK